MNDNQPIRLTQYSHGSGCGCKIAPDILQTILSESGDKPLFDQLIVGNQLNDDAAVMNLGNGDAIISTTDFFMPIVDDAEDFGEIASANAISDIYAMGGKPILAIAILGWPIDKIPVSEASKVLKGARAICKKAGIPLAGGHSIDSPEPIFGLAVTGKMKIKYLKTNAAARNGDLLFLTKPLGIGILTTARKQGKLLPNHAHIAGDIMKRLNDIGADFGKIPQVHAMTDVTGFGLLGHLTEMCEASHLRADIHFNQIPIIPESKIYWPQGCVPGGTNRNFRSYGHKIKQLSEEQKILLCDPQTSGGLLVAVDHSYRHDFEALLHQHHLPAKLIGILKKPVSSHLISVL